MHFENVLLVFSETRKIEGSEQAIHLVTMFIGNKQRYVVYTHSLRKLLCTCSYTSIHVHKAVIIAGALPGPISSYKIGRGVGLHRLHELSCHRYFSLCAANSASGHDSRRNLISFPII